MSYAVPWMTTVECLPAQRTEREQAKLIANAPIMHTRFPPHTPLTDLELPSTLQASSHDLFVVFMLNVLERVILRSLGYGLRVHV